MIKMILIIIGILFSLLLCFLAWCCCKASSLGDRKINKKFDGDDS